MLNVTPTADAGPDQYVNEEDTVNLTGTFTDPGTSTRIPVVARRRRQRPGDRRRQRRELQLRPRRHRHVHGHIFRHRQRRRHGTAVVYVYAYDVAPVATIVGLPAQSTVGVPINLTGRSAIFRRSLPRRAFTISGSVQRGQQRLFSNRATIPTSRSLPPRRACTASICTWQTRTAE